MKNLNLKGKLEFNNIFFGLIEVCYLNRGTKLLRNSIPYSDKEFIGFAILDKFMWSKLTGFELVKS